MNEIELEKHINYCSIATILRPQLVNSTKKNTIPVIQSSKEVLKSSTIKTYLKKSNKNLLQGKGNLISNDLPANVVPSVKFE